MISKSRQHLLEVMLAALSVAATQGCRVAPEAPAPDKSNVVSSSNASPPQQQRRNSKQHAESNADADHGKQVWNSYPDIPETLAQSHFPGQHGYESARNDMRKRLRILDGNIAQASLGRGMWSGGGGRDYVAGKYAEQLNGIVDEFQDATGDYYPATRKSLDHLTTNQNAVYIAVGRLWAMAGGSDGNGDDFRLGDRYGYTPENGSANDVSSDAAQRKFYELYWKLVRDGQRLDQIGKHEGWSVVAVPYRRNDNLPAFRNDDPNGSEGAQATEPKSHVIAGWFSHHPFSQKAHQGFQPITPQ